MPIWMNMGLTKMAHKSIGIAGLISPECLVLQHWSQRLATIRIIDLVSFSVSTELVYVLTFCSAS